MYYYLANTQVHLEFLEDLLEIVLKWEPEKNGPPLNGPSIISPPPHCFFLPTNLLKLLLVISCYLLYYALYYYLH